MIYAVTKTDGSVIQPHDDLLVAMKQMHLLGPNNQVRRQIDNAILAEQISPEQLLHRMRQEGLLSAPGSLLLN